MLKSIFQYTIPWVQLMDVIVNDNLSSGYHTYVWDANDAPSGLYLIQTDVNSNISTQKVLLIK